ncbi:hypothetical protein ACWIUD_01155 [Helicobacter sp. 23-1044]
MIQKILNIAKIAQTTQNNSIKNFNTTLPLLLEILQKTQKGFLLKLGNTTIEAKSNANLQLGAKYWAIVRDSGGELLISKLKMRPKIAESAKNSPIFFTPKDLEAMAKNADFVREFRDKLIDSALNTHLKDEFDFISNSLYALNQGILNLVIKEQNRHILLQIKRQKNEQITFCAVFHNLGIVSGSIYQNKILHLSVNYENVKKLLEKNTYKLDFSEVNIVVRDNSVLYEMMEDLFIQA